jgi:cytochrome c
MITMKFSLKAALAVAAPVAAIFAINSVGLAQSAASGGDVLFKQRCAMCHSVAKGKTSGVGPNLAGVVGRKSGMASDYAYSAGMKKANLVWNTANLDRFMAAPAKVVPGTKMVIAVSDAKQRATVVAYLASVK